MVSTHTSSRGILWELGGEDIYIYNYKYRNIEYVIVELPGQYDFFISGGISNDVSFEEDLLTKYPNLTCVAFDGTIALA